MKIGKVVLFSAIGIFVLIAVLSLMRRTSKKSVEDPQIGAHLSRQLISQAVEPTPIFSQPLENEGDFPSVNRIESFFTTEGPKFPIVETVVYSSQVSWLKGRPAWIADYASYFGTSRHFIARSLNGKPDYDSQKISEGRRFNVLNKNKNFQFYLLVDLTRKKMGFYYIDLDTNERVLVKTYPVGIGKEASTSSGSLTPLGRFTLGEKVAVYKPGIEGLFLDKKVEMIRVFGTRWIPFDRPIGDTTGSSKKLGIHGAPWEFDPETGSYIERRDVIGTLSSDGCLRMASEDMEELFSIIISRPTIVDIVTDFKQVCLPGIEKG